MELLPQLRSMSKPTDEFAHLGRRPEETLRDARFAAAFDAALGALRLTSADSWLSRLELTAPDNEVLSVPRLGDVILIRGCKPHFCDRRLYIVYKPSDAFLFGMARLDDTRWHSFGTMDEDARAVAFVAFGRDEALSQLPVPGLSQDANGNYAWDKTRAAELAYPFPLSESAQQVVANTLSRVVLD
jgi:hypothetical protein